MPDTLPGKRSRETPIGRKPWESLLKSECVMLELLRSGKKLFEGYNIKEG